MLRGINCFHVAFIFADTTAAVISLHITVFSFWHRKQVFIFNIKLDFRKASWSVTSSIRYHVINASKLHTENLVYGSTKRAKIAVAWLAWIEATAKRQPWKWYYQNCRKEFKYSTKRNAHTLIQQRRSYYLVEIPTPYIMRCLFFRKLYSIFLLLRSLAARKSCKKIHSTLTCFVG